MVNSSVVAEVKNGSKQHWPWGTLAVLGLSPAAVAYVFAGAWVWSYLNLIGQSRLIFDVVASGGLPVLMSGAAFSMSVTFLLVCVPSLLIVGIMGDFLNELGLRSTRIFWVLLLVPVFGLLAFGLKIRLESDLAAPWIMLAITIVALLMLLGRRGIKSTQKLVKRYWRRRTNRQTFKILFLGALQSALMLCILILFFYLAIVLLSFFIKMWVLPKEADELTFWGVMLSPLCGFLPGLGYFWAKRDARAAPYALKIGSVLLLVVLLIVFVPFQNKTTYSALKKTEVYLLEKQVITLNNVDRGLDLWLAGMPVDASRHFSGYVRFQLAGHLLLCLDPFDPYNAEHVRTATASLAHCALLRAEDVGLIRPADPIKETVAN